MNNTITEMKTTLEGMNSRITESEERISDLEDRMVKFTAAEQNKEKGMKRYEESLRDLWDITVCQHSHYSGSRRRERSRLKMYLKKL